MLVIKHSLKTSASATIVWKIWEDVSNWKTWDSGLEYSELDGPFKTGTTGRLKPKGGPLLKMRLTHVEPMRCFVDEGKLPFCRIIVSHFLKEVEGKREVTHQIEIKGMLSFLFAYLIGRTLRKNLPHEMEAMIEKAEAL